MDRVFERCAGLDIGKTAPAAEPLRLKASHGRRLDLSLAAAVGSFGVVDDFGAMEPGSPCWAQKLGLAV
jgi:hypothetical protein